MSQKLFLLIFLLIFLSSSTLLADIEHEVKAKETLSSIAREYNVSVQEIMDKNNITDPDKIKSGQILIIPLEEDFNPKHKVEPGETLSSIARKYSISLKELMEANNIEDPEHIKAGQVLTIPLGFTAEGSIHKVEKKETIWSIAQQYKVTVLALTEANSLGNPNILREGRLLVIPSSVEETNYINEIGDRAIIRDTVISLKAKPGNDAETVTQTILGDIVSVKEVADRWYFIMNPDGYFGWVEISSLAPVDDKILSYPVVIVNDLIADIMNSPSSEGMSLKKAVMGTGLPLIEKEEDWSEVMLPEGRSGWLKNSQLLFKQNPPQPAGRIVETAKKYETVPYLWGGTTALGVDCSGFIFRVYQMNGYTIPRDAESQFYYCEQKSDEELIPGDLVFFTTYLEGPSHVGIYLGNRNFIHASSSKGVTVSSLDMEYYKARYLGGGHVREMVNQ